MMMAVVEKIAGEFPVLFDDVVVVVVVETAEVVMSFFFLKPLLFHL